MVRSVTLMPKTLCFGRSVCSEVPRQRRSSLFSQVDIDLNAQTEELLSELKIREDDEGVAKLISWETVSHYWSAQPTLKAIHVFVRLPAAGECRSLLPHIRSADDIYCATLLLLVLDKLPRRV